MGFNMGDIVLHCDTDTPRNVLPLAIVHKTILCRDEFARSVKVKTKKNLAR